MKKVRTKNFNLGSEYCTRDPKEAAKELLKREYCDTHLYAENEHEAIFIPHVFVSDQHQKLEYPDLNFNGIEEFKMCMEKIIKDTTLEKEWYFGYIKHLNDNFPTNKNNKKEIDNWRHNMKYLCDNDTKRPSYLTDLTHRQLYEKEPMDIKNKPQNYYVCKMLENPSRAVGEIGERWLYEGLKSQRQLLKDAVVLHTLEIKAGKTQQEHDFVIFFPNRRLIIGIEAKNKFSDKNVDSAKKQLIKLQMFLKNQCKLEGWNFHPMIFTMVDTPEHSLDHFITSDENSFENRIRSIRDKYKELNIAEFKTEKDKLKSILGFLVFLMHVSKGKTGLIRTSNWADYVKECIENISTKENILFYTKQQLPIFESSEDYRYLLLLGGYGTGKTFLKKEKIKQLLNETQEGNKKIWYVLLSDKAILLKSSLENEWKKEIKEGRLEVVSKHFFSDYFVQDDSEKTSVFIHDLCYKKSKSKQPDSIRISFSM